MMYSYNCYQNGEYKIVTKMENTESSRLQCNKCNSYVHTDTGYQQPPQDFLLPLGFATFSSNLVGAMKVI